MTQLGVSKELERSPVACAGRYIDNVQVFQSHMFFVGDQVRDIQYFVGGLNWVGRAICNDQQTRMVGCCCRGIPLPLQHGRLGWQKQGYRLGRSNWFPVGRIGGMPWECRPEIGW